MQSKTLFNNLSSTYARATRAVSMVPVAYVCTPISPPSQKLTLSRSSTQT